MLNRYGTTSDMIVQEIEEDGVTRLLAIDNKGLYLTDQDRVDRMVADVNRYGVPREKTNKLLEKLGMNPLELFNANKHLVKTQTDKKAVAKLNPIKASKRRQ